MSECWDEYKRQQTDTVRLKPLPPVEGPQNGQQTTEKKVVEIVTPPPRLKKTVTAEGEPAKAEGGAEDKKTETPTKVTSKGGKKTSTQEMFTKVVKTKANYNQTTANVAMLEEMLGKDKK